MDCGSENATSSVELARAPPEHDAHTALCSRLHMTAGDDLQRTIGDAADPSGSALSALHSAAAAGWHSFDE